MPRYRLTLEYDGTPFVGWQRQDNGTSVQGVLESAGVTLTGHPAVAVAAGRTDAGVHALAMSTHIDLQKEYPVDTVRDALNFHLKPHPVVVLEAQNVDDTFHARFSCVRRHYVYRIISRRAPLALENNRMWRLPFTLDVPAMATAASILEGKHDFTTFRSAQCQAKSPVKTLDTVSVKMENQEIHIYCAAPSFLHNQVRSIVGTLERVGAGRWSPQDVKSALEARDRSACGPVAPACGLYFAKADYPA